MSTASASVGSPDPAPPARRPASWWARVLGAAAVLVAAGGFLTARVVVAGEAELQASTRALERGDAREAVVRARRAAAWYAPGAPHVEVAYRRLAVLARAAEEHRHPELALLAWYSVRTAAIESRWLLAARSAELAQANREIARLRATGEHRAAEPDASIAAAELASLSRPHHPRAPWVVALVAAFLLATVGLLAWARAAADVAGRLRWGRGRVGLLLTAAGVLLWLLAAWRA